jgi:Uma2 family endonuclease
MSRPYPETLSGELLMRLAPGPRHEVICARLHDVMRASVANLSSTRLLPPRTELHLSTYNTLCPDLALIVAATGKPWLAAEIVSSDDHAPDTVLKKQVYEEVKLPRVWMIDPRYDNVEVYHATPYGLALKAILAGKDVLADKLLPEFALPLADLFAATIP